MAGNKVKDSPDTEIIKKRVLIIKNPKSGQGNSGIDEFSDLLLSNGVKLDTRILEK